MAATLQELILAVHEVAGVERIRLGSLEPGIITEDFVKTLVCSSEILPALPPFPAEWM